MSNLSILISGAGIAGCVTAYFLAEAGFQVTVIERAAAPRTGGQNVDVRGHGLTILQRMGVEAEVRSKTTREKGFRFVDARGRSWADFPVGSGEGLTGEVEIMRGDLAMLLYERARSKAEFVFGESIAVLEEDEKGIEVAFENGMASRRFDVVVAADGWASRTRSLAFGSQLSNDAIKSLGQWAGWCTVPYETSNSDWAQWYNAPGRRLILLRPDNTCIRRASLWVMPDDDSFEEVFRGDVQKQKDLWARTFNGAGWKSEQIVEAMLHADDFYMQKIAQVKISTWSKGRVVLVGDAGYCPSPISGMGTTTAIVGAYVLAGELVKNRQDPKAAFTAYEETLREFVKTAQRLAPGAPGMANPRGELGITVLYSFLMVVSWVSRLMSLGASFNPPSNAMDLPDYQFNHNT